MLKIKSVSEEGIPIIRELALNTWPQTYARLLSSEQIGYMMDWMYSESSLQRQMNEGSRYILIYDNDDPLGFAAFFEAESFIYKLDKLYLLPSHQHKGIGRFVIDYIIDELKKTDATALELQVNRDNTARYFYEKMGFDIIKEKDFDIGNGYFMNDYIMERKL